MGRIVARKTNIRKLAIDRDINPTAHAIALEAGITYETIRQMFRGKSPSPETMSALMQLFGVGWDELFVLLDNDDPVAAAG